MFRALPPVHALPLHGTAATRRLEALAQASLPAHALMRQAGLEVARCALAVAPHARTVWVAAGPGNNGGDGLEAAMHLQAAGKQVLVTRWEGSHPPPKDAADALARAQAAGIRFVDSPPPLVPADLAVDALLGLGANRAPETAIAHRIRQLNALPCPVLAVDLPSGLCADSGRLLGDEAVAARHTLALLTLKPGLFTAQGRDHAGEVWWSRLGVAAEEPPDAHLSGADALLAPARGHGAHKGSRGDTWIVGGGPGMVGAAWLAARAAHAAGSGRVFLSLLTPGPLGPDPSRPELMTRPADWPPSDEDLARLTVVAGCGGGSAIAAALPRVLRAAHRLVLDADGLNAVANDDTLASLLHARAAQGLRTVLTPHPLEAARLLGSSTADIQADRLNAARRLADRTAAVVVLKGSGTVVAAPSDSRPWINPTGNASLATAGTGDVLAGWMGGLWSALPGSGGDGTQDRQALEAALSSAFLHGAAADQAGVDPLRAADLVERMLLRAQPPA